MVDVIFEQLVRLGNSEFEIPFIEKNLKNQKKKMQELHGDLEAAHKEEKQCQDALNRAGAAEQGYFDWLWAALPEETSAIKTNLAAAHKRVENITRQRSETEAHLNDFLDRRYRLMEEVKQIKEQIYRNRKSRNVSPDVQKSIKMAHLKLAMCVDSRSTQCAEALGKLYLRTPAFVLEYGLADFESRKAHAYLENDRALLGDLLPLPFDEELDENISDKFRIIDDLVVEAGHQVDQSILLLMSVLAANKLSNNIRDHLPRAIISLLSEVEREDNLRIQIQNVARSAVTVHWPTEGANQKTKDAYAKLKERVDVYIRSEQFEFLPEAPTPSRSTKARGQGNRISGVPPGVRGHGHAFLNCHAHKTQRETSNIKCART